MAGKGQPLIVRELFDDVTQQDRRGLREDPAEWADDLADLIGSIESQLERADRQLDEYRDAVFAEVAADDAVARRQAEAAEPITEDQARSSCEIAAWAEFEAERERVAEWKRRTKTILKLARARHRRVARYAAEAEEQRRAGSADRLLHELLDEVDRHRESVVEDEPEPAEADDELWATADRVRGIIEGSD